jgi:mannose-6-phosphate isomerase
MTHALYPLHLQPSLHVKVWGGRRLASHMHKTLPDEQPYGEAWEIHDTAIISNGTLAGQTLGAALATYGHDLIGAHNDPADGLPLLAKLLDASDWLSVQVHPDDAQARQLEGDPRGKTEAWVMLATEADAKLVIGVEAGTEREAVAQAIRENKLEPLLAYAEISAGDVLFIPANTVHAIGPGILLYEIQQSSDLTYRLYDWGRVGLDGQPRPLHIDKGVQVANLTSLPKITHINPDTDIAEVVTCDYFRTDLHRLRAAATHSISTNGTFHALTCTTGRLQVTSGDAGITLSSGQSAFIPAVLPSYTLAGVGETLVSYQAAFR